MLAWLTGGIAGAAAGFLMDAGIVNRTNVSDDTSVGYWAAIYLSRRAYPYTVCPDGVTFSRKRHDL